MATHRPALDAWRSSSSVRAATSGVPRNTTRFRRPPSPSPPPSAAAAMNLDVCACVCVWSDGRPVGQGVHVVSIDPTLPPTSGESSQKRPTSETPDPQLLPRHRGQPPVAADAADAAAQHCEPGRPRRRRGQQQERGHGCVKVEVSAQGSGWGHIHAAVCSSSDGVGCVCARRPLLMLAASASACCVWLFRLDDLKMRPDKVSLALAAAPPSRRRLYRCCLGYAILVH